MSTHKKKVAKSKRFSKNFSGKFLVIRKALFVSAIKAVFRLVEPVRVYVHSELSPLYKESTCLGKFAAKSNSNINFLWNPSEKKKKKYRIRQIINCFVSP